MSAASPPRSIPAGDGAAGRYGERPALRFFSLAPALLAGALALRVWALYAGAQWQPMSPKIVVAALGDDLLVVARSLPLLCLLSWPLLRIRSAPWRAGSALVLWTVWLAVQIGLEQYYLATRVSLGADLFGYSWQEIATTVAGGARMDGTALAGWALPLLALAMAFAFCWRHPLPWRTRAAVVVLLACTASWLPPLASASLRDAGDAARELAQNKLAAFAKDSARYWLGEAPAPVADASASVGEDSNPDYPFLHADRTPDALGPFFAKTAAQPPHLVFIVVEGLGRSFSGPDASRGSFTPFLDELAGRSLYWSNFLAAQGRTFGVLPSVFGSLPFADKGYAALGERMPPHAGLFNLLGRQGYATRFYAGTDLAFDNERAFLQRQGVGRIVDLTSFGPGYRTNPFSSWGYDDSELIARVLADGAIADGAAAQPTLTVVQTISMHTSYRFAGQDRWRRRFEQRLDELGIAAPDKPGYRAFADIYSTILFTDDALRRYFEAAQKAPGYENTLFVITGDHRLPELPMDTKIERFHVPLLVFSPMLRAPARIRAVSSHLDITPSILAFLSHNYGLQRPAQATWTGPGLDTLEAFASRHDIPLKHEKTALADFVAGPWFLSRDQLFVIEDGMRLTRSEDSAAKAQVAARFERYRQANAQFVRTLKLSPEGDRPALAAYSDAAPPDHGAAFASLPAPQRRALYAHGVAAPEGTDRDRIEITAQFTNTTAQPVDAFVPLLVLSDERGREVRESYAAALQLAAGSSGQARFALDLAGVESGRYFLAVLPTHPASGKRVGDGVYRIPLKVRCCAPGGGARARP